MDSDRVWRDTHRLGGKTFVAAGLVTVAVALLSPQRGFAFMFAALVLAAMVPLVYSYVAWRRERN
ncbi:MAG: SdpI family protein [Longimicrobiales bacterium]